MRFFIEFSRAGVKQILNGKIEPINHSIPELFSRPAFGLFDGQGYGFISSFYDMMRDISAKARFILIWSRCRTVGRLCRRRGVAGCCW
jgi:hypothetical protein